MREPIKGFSKLVNSTTVVSGAHPSRRGRYLKTLSDVTSEALCQRLQDSPRRRVGGANRLADWSKPKEGRCSLHAIDWASFPTHVADLRVLATARLPLPRLPLPPSRTRLLIERLASSVHTRCCAQASYRMRRQSMAAREIRCHLVLVDSVNGDLVSSDILSFPSA